MTDDIPTSMAEAMAEIRRLQNALTQSTTRNCEQIMELARLRVRIMEYEARAAVTLGTLEQPTEDEPATITHNVPPSAPPHVGHTIKWPPRIGDDHE